MSDIILPVGPDGISYVRTHTGRTIAGISGDAVRAQVQFSEPRQTANGEPANSVILGQNGSIDFVAADLGAIDPTVMEYGNVYIANGWTVEAFQDGTRFMNNDSSQQFWVSITDVNSLGHA